MKYEKERDLYISFCGSYCHICDWHTGEIRRIAYRTLSMLNEYGGFKKQFEKGNVNLDNFRRGLEILAESGICSGCKAEIPDYSNEERDRCDIRRCCSEKGFLLCNQCQQFPCDKLTSNLGVIKWHTVENLREIEQIGLKQWIDNQWKDYSKNR